MVIPTLLQHKASLYRFVSDGVHSKVTFSAKKNKHMPFKFKVTILNHCLKLNEYHCFFFLIRFQSILPWFDSVFVRGIYVYFRSRMDTSTDP